MITQYFKDLFGSTTRDEQMSDRVRFQQITEEQRQSLVLPVTEER